MAVELPTGEQIRSLAPALTASVIESETDSNGHMNVLYYLARNSAAADAIVREVGVDDDYRQKRRLGLFTTEHPLAYYSELRLGANFSVYGRVLARSDKAIHMMTFLLDRDHDRLANTLEIMLIHVDLERRRATPLPEDAAVALDEQLATSSALAWDAPTCGVIGIRR
ncbi:thioesterase family protein [Nocardia elegans]|uniref:thioesterase family protein n=1 Tax=Nocardia elegans TaxID=300029 RepID=UPI0018957E3F|nr:thioesterase family protein [Nocardia elegans]MBF6451137.1 thioesterase family protein [Nocardia elegans]